MPQTQINCPNCRQPIVADVQQLFDVAQDPRAKEKLLSGRINVASCPQCNYQGDLAIPIVYHNPDKEMLYTFFPPEMALPMEEQERILGPLITKVFNNLPQDQRKGYLLSPKPMFTFKGLIENILEGDGITKEMLEAQEARMNLIQKLLTLSDVASIEAITKEKSLIDDEFFSLFARLIETAVYTGDENTSKKMQELQGLLLEHSVTGKRLQIESEEIQKARGILEKHGDQLTRKKLLELILTASNDNVLQGFVQMMRPGMDYEFFQLLSSRIGKSNGKQKDSLITLREKLLELTREVDANIDERIQAARKNVNSLTQVEDVKEIIMQNLGAIDQYFVHALTDELKTAHDANDLDRSTKLQEALDVIEELSSTPPEYAIIDELMASAEDEESLNKVLRELPREQIAKLIELVANLVGQVQSGVDKAPDKGISEENEVLARLKLLYDSILRFSAEN